MLIVLYDSIMGKNTPHSIEAKSEEWDDIMDALEVLAYTVEGYKPDDDMCWSFDMLVSGQALFIGNNSACAYVTNITDEHDSTAHTMRFFLRSC